jgi:predicted  nucleic acid-binding Zn-ribbon protein
MQPFEIVTLAIAFIGAVTGLLAWASRRPKEQAETEKIEIEKQAIVIQTQSKLMADLQIEIARQDDRITALEMQNEAQQGRLREQAETVTVLRETLDAAMDRIEMLEQENRQLREQNRKLSADLQKYVACNGVRLE